MPARLLIVEDELPVRQMLRLLLEDEGFEVSEAADGESGLTRFAVDAPDLVLVDLRLPGMDGLELCRHLRQRTDVPIIVVSAQVDSNDVVAGLDAGADDYVTKPFVATELTARIRAALRRATIDADPSHENFAFADVEIAPASGIVTKGGEPVHLTKTEFRLLTEFARSAGLVLSRDQLLERVWGYEYLGDSRLIDAHVRRLRMKIETDPTEPKLLLTMRGLGYKLELPAEAAET